MTGAHLSWIKRWTALSLRQTLFLGAGLGMLLPALVLAVLQITNKLDTEIDLRVRAPMNQYADVLAHGLSEAIWNVDQASAIELIDAVMRNPDVVRISVSDEYHHVFAHRERPGAQDASLLQEERDVVHNGARVGRINLALSTERVRSELIGDLIKMALALGAQVVISFALIWMLFDQRMVRPLQLLQLGAQRLARGELDQPLQSRRSDEIGKLAQGLDTMRSNLAALISERDQQNATLQAELEVKRRYEAKIVELNSTLEQRVSERTIELTQALSQLSATQDALVQKEKLAALGSLVAGIAHELNTPLGNSFTVASTMLDHALEFTRALDNGVKRSTLDTYVANTQLGGEILMRNLRRAVDLVASFKQVAVDQTSENLRMFRLRETVGEILMTVGPSIRKTSHSVAVDIPESITMTSFPGPLGQVITNLVNNALLHGLQDRQQGIISIAARLQGADTVDITVSDNGVGIPEAHLNRVFDPFFTTKLGQGGSGLGLNIAYNLVTQTLGGTVRVESPMGQGARFILNLPLVVPAPIASLAPTSM
jgi:two-component system NtrC family sensor kinase